MTDSAAIDPRTPVIVGVGQHNRHVERGEPPVEPVELMLEALRLAESDAGVTGLLASADEVRVPALLSWRYGDPGALVAERVGATGARTALTVMGGNYVQTLVNATARDIAAGDLDVVLLTGAEAWRTRTSARAEGIDLGWTTQPDGTRPGHVYGEDDPELMGPAEVAREIYLPIQLYPMFDVALRAHEGLGVAEHRARIAALWAAFSDVAAGNPHAWSQERHSAEALATPTPDNRMVGFPYTKLLNSNNNVEMAAALVMCSAGRAEALGISRDRWVFPHAGTDAHDHWYVSNRDELHESPAIRLTGRRVLELAGIGLDDLAHVDLYSCFPSAVQVAAKELGLGLDRQLTVTGGMSFAGGPWNNYVMHSIATMVGLLREDSGARGLVTANGGYLTKHSMGVYSTEPPADGFRWESCQSEVDALPSREVVDEVEGPATVEAYTVVHSRDGQPEKAFAALRLPDGRRGWATSTHADLMEAMEAEEWVGRPVTGAAGGTFEPADG